MISLEMAKGWFRMHGVDAHGTVVLRRTLARGKELASFVMLPRCMVGLEACGANHRARELVKRGHEVRLMRPRYM